MCNQDSLDPVKKYKFQCLIQDERLIFQDALDPVKQYLQCVSNVSKLINFQWLSKAGGGIASSLRSGSVSHPKVQSMSKAIRRSTRQLARFRLQSSRARVEIDEI